MNNRRSGVDCDRNLQLRTSRAFAAQVIMNNKTLAATMTKQEPYPLNGVRVSGLDTSE